MRPDPHTLPVTRAIDLAEPDPDYRWMIEPLWLRAAVGVIGAAAKCGKTHLALDMALSVATSTRCLGSFPVRHPGSVLIYMAEDAESAVKDRLLALCRHRGLDLAEVDHLYAITTSSLRLDRDTDQMRLANTLAEYKPTLLVLDPLVRLHALNENDSGEMSRLLGYLRELQRTHLCSVVLVHHTRKNGSSSGHGGHELRGSSDIFAWLDSSLYLRRHKEHLTLLCEHRSAPAPGPISLALFTDADCDQHAAHLEVVSHPDSATDSEQRQIEDRLLALLAAAPLSRAQLRSALAIRNERLGHLLERLAAQGRIVYADNLWRLPFP
jgi:hypothetical protein